MATVTFDTHHYIKNLQAKGFSEAQAEAVIDVIHNARASDISPAATKTEFNTFKSEMRNDFAKLELRFDQKISETQLRFDQKISEAKIDIIKWMFGGFLSIALMIVGLFIKLM